MRKRSLTQTRRLAGNDMAPMVLLLLALIAAASARVVESGEWQARFSKAPAHTACAEHARAVPADYLHLGRVARNETVRLLFAVKLQAGAQLDAEFWQRSGEAPSRLLHGPLTPQRQTPSTPRTVSG